MILFKLSSFALCWASRHAVDVVVHTRLVLLSNEMLLDLLLLEKHRLRVVLLLLDESLLHFNFVTGLVVPVALDESLPQL